jgi:DNA-binding NarL/FixJ family response regulator
MTLADSKALETAKKESKLTASPQRQPEGTIASGKSNKIAQRDAKHIPTVLVVDDYAPFIRLVFSILRQRTELLIIGQAADGLEAVHKAEELQPDLILLDIGLPKLNGIEAARRVRKLAGHTRILFVSQESSADVVRDALALGASGYILKANAGRELMPAIEAVLRHEHFIGSGLEPL